MTDIDKIKQDHIQDGQIRYKIWLSDTPLAAQEYLAIQEAITAGARVEIVVRVLP